MVEYSANWKKKEITIMTKMLTLETVCRNLKILYIIGFAVL